MEELNALSRIDHFFSERVLFYLGQEGNLEMASLLARVMAEARNGHLCIPFEGNVAQLHPFVVHDQDRLYLEKNWQLEQIIKTEVLRLCHKRELVDKEIALPLNSDQANAVAVALENQLTLLTGGPGTGKTYTAAAIASAFEGKKILLAAPTGRAADHLARSLHKQLGVECPSSTLHRILKIGGAPPWPKDNFFLEADLLIIDECSMIDAPLFATLLKAIPAHCTTVLMGDPHQLSPVGIGSIFSDFTVSSYPFGKATLSLSMRTENRELLQLANDVLAGKQPSQNVLPWPESRGAFFQTLEIMTQAWISGFIAVDPHPAHLFAQTQKFRLLNALRQGAFGVEEINAFFLDKIKEATSFGSWWSAPIMITRNDERTGLSNGELGVYLEKKGERASGKVYFSSQKEPLPLLRLPSYEFAFCTSVHKSQGSEYDEVLVILPPGSENFGREMLYTALTRSRHKVSLMADGAILDAMVKKTIRKLSGIR